MPSRFIFTGMLVGCMLMITGCAEEKVPDPPTARAELTARLYDALKLQRNEEALAIIGKLMALDQNDADLMEMRDRIICNICTNEVQKMLDSGRIDSARRYLRSQRRKYPMLGQLQILENEIVALQELSSAAAGLANADSIADLTAALDRIAPLAAKYPQAKRLQQDIQLRRKDLARLRAAEQVASEKNQTPAAGNTEK